MIACNRKLLSGQMIRHKHDSKSASPWARTFAVSMFTIIKEQPRLLFIELFDKDGEPSVLLKLNKNIEKNRQLLKILVMGASSSMAPSGLA